MSSSRGARSRGTDDAAAVLTAVLSRPKGKGPKPAIVSGCVSSIAADGRIFVDFDGNTEGPLPARSLVVDFPGDHPDGVPGTPVLLAIEPSRPQQPIILGILHEKVRSTRERIVVAADREILIKCGRSSILLKADGKVIIRGTHLLSRASSVNRIKGGSVAIN